LQPRSSHRRWRARARQRIALVWAACGPTLHVHRQNLCARAGTSARGSLRTYNDISTHRQAKRSKCDARLHRKWRINRAVADSLEERAHACSASRRLPQEQWKSARTTSDRAAARGVQARIKTQTVLPSPNRCNVVLACLPPQINAQVDGWKTSPQAIAQQLTSPLTSYVQILGSCVRQFPPHTAPPNIRVNTIHRSQKAVRYMRREYAATYLIIIFEGRSVPLQDADSAQVRSLAFSAPSSGLLGALFCSPPRSQTGRFIDGQKCCRECVRI